MSNQEISDKAKELAKQIDQLECDLINTGRHNEAQQLSGVGPILWNLSLDLGEHTCP
jgi:hypothetical protein